MRQITMTFDTGKEFAHHARIAKALKAQCYFAAPYCSGQRGCKENLNGLLRQYYPKKNTDFTKVPHREVAKIERYSICDQKKLGWQSLAQVFKDGKPVQRFTY